jgi:hypothetical protein
VRSVKVVFGIASLPPAQADATRLAALVRGHWGIENRLHWVRDVVCGEDASRIHTGKAPQVMAVFRNLAISFLGLLGYDTTARSQVCAISHGTLTRPPNSSPNVPN